MCHEIGHIILHFRSRKKLARNKLGSPENYAIEEVKEKEANLFAGALMVPMTSLDTTLSDYTVAKHYRTSYSVAKKCKRQAVTYKKYIDRRGR